MASHDRIGKFLAYVLRHQPEAIGLELDAAGWASIPALLRAVADGDDAFDLEQLLAVVEADDKGRFELDPSDARIRARQGHSVSVDLGLEPVPPPAVLYQGTAARFLASIQAQGLLPQGRHHVHLSEDIETAHSVGARHGKPIVLRVRAEAMARAGHEFYRTENGVWLTDAVPPEYLARL